MAAALPKPAASPASETSLRRLLALARRAEFQHPALLGACLDRALQTLAGTLDVQGRVRLLVAKFRCVEVLGQGQRMGDALLLACNEATALGLNAEVGVLLCAVGRLRYAEGKYREAASLWAQAIDICQLNADRASEVEARVGLGQVYDALGDGHTAARLHATAAAQAEALGDAYLISKVAINQGFNLRVVGDLDGARAQFEKALNCAERGQVRHYVAESHWQLAALNVDLERLDLAEAHASQARQMAEASRYGWLLSGVLKTQADIHLRRGDARQATSVYSSALARSIATGARRQQADCHQKLAELAEARGDLATALVHVRESMRLESALREQLNVAERLDELRQYDLADKPPLEMLLALSSDPILQGDDVVAGLKSLCAAGLQILQANSVAVWEYAEGGAALRARVTTSGLSGAQVPAEVAAYLLRLQAHFGGSPEPRIAHDVRLHPDYQLMAAELERQHIKASIEVPILRRGELTGVLVVTRETSASRWLRDEVLFASSLAAMAGHLQANRQIKRMLDELRKANETLESRVAERTAALEQSNQELARANAALSEASLVDPLTGVRNRRYLLQQIDADVELSERNWPSAGYELVFYLIDIDHFKRVNDQHGHNAGDQVLVEVARRIAAVARKSSMLVRWGGEEFLLVARKTESATAHVQAERICATLEQQAFEITSSEQPIAVSCSIGFAVFPLRQGEGFMPWTQVLELADQALYRVKQSGRKGWVGVLPVPGAALPGGAPELAALVDGGRLRLVQRDTVPVARP